MILYHGSSVPGIQALRPLYEATKVYLTDSAAIAAIYAYTPLTKPLGWFTYYVDKGGIPHYDEYFPNALSTLYGGASGFIYQCEGSFTRHETMPWVYHSDGPVPVTSCRYIPDLYAELMELEQTGRLVIHRYEDFSPAQQEAFRRQAARSAEGHAPGSEYHRFLNTHFPDLPP